MGRSIISVAAVTLCSVWMSASGPPAAAQSPSPATTPPPAAAPSADISDQKIDQVAAAISGVQKVHSDYAAKYEAASEADKEKIVAQATEASKKAVTDQGLSVDEYNSMIDLARNNPDVRAKIAARLKGSNP
jgi:hypothetical protein